MIYIYKPLKSKVSYLSIKIIVEGRRSIPKHKKYLLQSYNFL